MILTIVSMPQPRIGRTRRTAIHSDGPCRPVRAFEKIHETAVCVSGLAGNVRVGEPALPCYHANVDVFCGNI